MQATRATFLGLPTETRERYRSRKTRLWRTAAKVPM